jgi:hypothetical protein
MVNIDNIGANDYLFTGGISITKRILWDFLNNYFQTTTT